MRIVLLYFFVLTQTACVAQHQTPVEIDVWAQNVWSKKKLFVRFEQLDTSDEKGRRFKVARSYYFDNNKKNLLLITARENLTAPRKGLQITYIFLANRLAKVRVVPSRTVCFKCSANYYFFKDSLICKAEHRYSVTNIYSLLVDSKRLAMKVCHDPGNRLASTKSTN